MTIKEEEEGPAKSKDEEGVKETAGIKPILKTSKTAGKPGMLSKSKGGGLFGDSSSKS